MSYICPSCSLDPLNHSLTLLLEKDNILYFYTCPSKAKLYFDKDGILNHYNGVLSEIQQNKQWTWIFDAEGFDFKHFSQFNIAIGLSKMISTKFSNNLNQIIIINPTFYISSIYNIIYPFLNNKIRNIIQIIYEPKTHFDILP